MAVAIDKVSTMTLPNYIGLGTAIDGLTAKQAALVLSTRNLSQAELEEVIIQNDLLTKYGAEELVKAGLLSTNSYLLTSEKAVSAEKLEQSIRRAALNKDLAQEFIQKQLIVTANGEESVSTIILNKALMDEAVKRGVLSEEKSVEILSTYGVVTADVTETASKSALTVATLAQVKAQLALIATNPIAWIIAIAAAIYGTVKAFDAFTVSIEEASEKTKSSKQELDKLTSEINDLNNELETTKDRIDELLEKADSGSISLLEEEELNKLKEQNNELEHEIALKEKLAKIDAKEVADNAAFSLTYKTDDNKWDDEYHATDRIDKLQNYVDSANLYQEKISEVNQQILDIEESATDSSYKKDSVYKNLIKQQEKYQDELLKTEELINSTYKELSAEDDGLYYNGKVVDGYDDLVNRLKTVYMAVELYLNDGNIEDTAKDYVEAIKNKLIESGLSEEISNAVVKGFSEEELSSIMDSDSIDWSKCLGLDDANAVIENIKEQLRAIKPTDENPISFNAEDYKDQIDDIQSAISTLCSALESFNKGELDKLSVIDLMQEFPSLAPYIDLTADGFGNLSEGLSTLIEHQPDELIQKLNDLKESLDTEEERKQVDLLIDSFQRLSSYGDTGLEAYANATSNTWDGTADVIEGVTTQFENLAKVQEAVANGLTMTATKAAELAKMYPEILTNAELSANGQITLNEEVVNSILAGDQSIINAQIAKLEADKAELTSKQAYAEAQLDIVKQVGEGEGKILPYSTVMWFKQSNYNG